MRPRLFVVECALAVAFGLLFLVTLVSRDWIEHVFDVDPDDGSGALEWVIVAALLTVSGLFAFLAQRAWRVLNSDAAGRPEPGART